MRGQRNFRHQNDGGLTHQQGLAYHFQINLGFSAAGNAVQQKRALAKPQRGQHDIQRLPLLIRQNRRLGRRHLLRAVRRAEYLPLKQTHQSVLLQHLQRLARIVYQRRQVRQGMGVPVCQKAQQHCPFGRSFLILGLGFRVHAGHQLGAPFLLLLDASRAHGGRKHQPQRFGQGAMSFQRHFIGQFQQRRQQRRVGVQHPGHGPQFFSRHVSLSVQRYHKAIHLPPSQGNPHPGAHAQAHSIRHKVGKGTGHIGMHHIHDDLCNHPFLSFCISGRNGYAAWARVPCGGGPYA